MALSRDQLDTFDANSQHEFVLKAADSVSRYIEDGTDIFLDTGLHIPHTLQLVDKHEIIKIKNEHIQGGSRYVMGQAADTIPEFQEWSQALEAFVSTIVNFVRDKVGEALGWESNQQKLAESFAQDTRQIGQTVKELAESEGVEPTSIMNAISGGIQQATSSLDAIQNELKDEGREAISELLGTEGDAENKTGAAIAAAGETYRRVYRAAVRDLKDKNLDYDSSPDTQDAVRNQAHRIAAQISGMQYDGENKELVPTRTANGQYAGMYGYIRNNIEAIDQGRTPETEFTLAPDMTAALEAVRTQQTPEAASDGRDVDAPTTPAPTPGERTNTRAIGE